MGRLCRGIGGNADAVARGNAVYANEDYRHGIEHAHVSAEIAYDYGQTVAEALGNLKELTSNDLPDSARDQWNNKVGRQIAEYARDHGLTKNDLDHLTMDALKNGHLKTDPKAPDPEPWDGPSENWQGASAGRLYPDGSTDGGDGLFPWNLPGGPGGGDGGWSLPGWMKGLIGARGRQPA